MAEEYGIHVKTVDGPVEVLKPGIDRRVTALEAANKEQDTAISNAQTTADEAKDMAEAAQTTANQGVAASGVTAGSYGPTGNVAPAHRGTFTVPYITVDARGRVTNAATRTITLPADANTHCSYCTHCSGWCTHCAHCSYCTYCTYCKISSGGRCGSSDSCFIRGQFPTPSGPVDISRIVVGDVIIDTEGIPHKVTHLFRAPVRGKKVMECGEAILTADHVFLEDGEPVSCDIPESVNLSPVHDGEGKVVGRYPVEAAHGPRKKTEYLLREAWCGEMEYLPVVKSRGGRPVWADFSGLIVQLAVEVE